MKQIKRKGALDGGNKEDLDLLIAVWSACLGLVIVLLYCTGAIR